MKNSKGYRAIAHYYDAEYANNPVLDNDVPFLFDHLPRKRQRVLELCCGTARASIPLAQAGHQVVGVDYDADLLKLAIEKRDGVGIPESSLQLIRGDVLKGAKLDQKPFDFAFLIFNTLLNFTSLDEQDRVLQFAHAHLRPGGRFWVDVFYPDLAILANPHHAHYDSTTFYVPSLGRAVHRTTEIARSRKISQVQEVTFHYRWADDLGDIHHEKIDFDMTWMFPRELELLLDRNGFAVERLYGNYDGSAASAESPRIIAMAKKR